MQPPGTGGVAEQIKALSKRIDELSRPKHVSPRVIVKLDVDVPIEGDVYAAGNWSVVEDSHDIFRPNGTDGINFSRIVIPVRGVWAITMHARISGADGTAVACRVTVDATSAAVGTIANDTGSILFGNAEGSTLTAYRPGVYLDDTHTLYWMVYSNAPATLETGYFLRPTEVCVQYVKSV